LTLLWDRSMDVAMATNFTVKNGRNRPTHLHSSSWHSDTDWNIAILVSKGSMFWLVATSCTNLVNFGPVTPKFKRGKYCTPHRRSAVWLRPHGGATARTCGITTEFCGAISTQFCFSYSLEGVTAMPRGLHAGLCHAFLVYLASAKVPLFGFSETMFSKFSLHADCKKQWPSRSCFKKTTLHSILNKLVCRT